MILKRVILFVLTGILLTGTSSFRIPSPKEQEYLLKAAFLYRFCDYVEWSNDDSDVFNIAILGESGILPPLLDISKDKRTKNKRIVVRQYNNASEIGSCQMIFISRTYKLPVETVISKVDYKPVLVITEQRSDFDKGAHLNFLISYNKLKFEVNLKTTSRSGLKISSQLLQHALVIKR
jgi:hypothetical protein